MICGDCILPDLGISAEDRKILADNISIIYHCAATIRFDEQLRTAVLLNTRGTKLMLELAESLPKLEVSVRGKSTPVLTSQTRQCVTMGGPILFCVFFCKSFTS